MDLLVSACKTHSTVPGMFMVHILLCVGKLVVYLLLLLTLVLLLESAPSQHPN